MRSSITSSVKFSDRASSCVKWLRGGTFERGGSTAWQSSLKIIRVPCNAVFHCVCRIRGLLLETASPLSKQPSLASRPTGFNGAVQQIAPLTAAAALNVKMGKGSPRIQNATLGALRERVSYPEFLFHLEELLLERLLLPLLLIGEAAARRRLILGLQERTESVVRRRGGVVQTTQDEKSARSADHEIGSGRSTLRGPFKVQFQITAGRRKRLLVK